MLETAPQSVVPTQGMQNLWEVCQVFEKKRFEGSGKETKPTIGKWRLDGSTKLRPGEFGVDRAVICGGRLLS